MEKFFIWLEGPNVLSTAKTITYRIISTVTTFTTIFAFTNSIKDSSIMTLIFTLYKPVQFWIHERLWLVWERRRENRRISILLNKTN